MRFLLTENTVINENFSNLLEAGRRLALGGERRITSEVKLLTKDIIIIKEVCDKNPNAEREELKRMEVNIYAYFFFDHNNIIFNSSNSEFIVKKTEKDLLKDFRHKYPGRELFGPSWFALSRWYKPDFCRLFYIGAYSFDRLTRTDISYSMYKEREENGYFDLLEQDLIIFVKECAREYNNILNKNYMNFNY